jgi:hypothetical protein
MKHIKHAVPSLYMNVLYKNFHTALTTTALDYL